jgi:uracil-DNA glycosylase
MPVVPTYLNRGKVMLLGEYPNCRFATITDSIGNVEQYVPIADINEPFEPGRYFNGRQIQQYPTGQSLKKNYLEPLGLDLITDVWLTNVVKCFLMQERHIETYDKLSWVGAGLPNTTAAYDDYFQIAAVCVMRHLAHEIQECQPKLVIAFGERVYRMIHSSDDFLIPGPDLSPFGDITGTPLRAGQQVYPLDTRNQLFKDLNVIHLYHPSGILRFAQIRNKHFNEDVPPTQAFLAELGLP